MKLTRDEMRLIIKSLVAFDCEKCPQLCAGEKAPCMKIVKALDKECEELTDDEELSLGIC